MVEIWANNRKRRPVSWAGVMIARGEESQEDARASESGVAAAL